VARIVDYTVGKHRHAPPNADETLRTMQFHLDTGNDVDITPAMRHVGDDELRVIFVQCWREHPSADELDAVKAYLDQYFEQGAGELSGVMSLEQGAATAEHWLSGRKPS
jgi:hypothetical protein